MKQLKSGSPDPDFAEGGRVELGEGRSNLKLRRFLLDDQQRIVGVGGSERIGTGAARVTVARYTAQGRLDASFDEDGYWLSLPLKSGDGGLDLGARADGTYIIAALQQERTKLLYKAAEGQARESTLTPDDATADGNARVAIQRDGGAWVAFSYLYPDWSGRAALTHRRPDGHPDAGFAENGTLTLGEGSQAVQLIDMVWRETRNDVILVLNVRGGPASGYVLLCIDASTGAPKDSFAEDGRFTYEVSGPAYGYTSFSHLLYENGQLWLAGNVVERASGAIHCFFLRLTDDGRIDLGFNQGNPVVIKGMQPNVGVQSDGKVLLLASTVYPDNILRRYLPDGELDHAFGEAGEVRPGRRDEEIRTLLVQADDKLLLSAQAGSLSRALYRLLG